MEVSRPNLKSKGKKWYTIANLVNLESLKDNSPNLVVLPSMPKMISLLLTPITTGIWKRSSYYLVNEKSISRTMDSEFFFNVLTLAFQAKAILWNFFPHCHREMIDFPSFSKKKEKEIQFNFQIFDNDFSLTQNDNMKNSISGFKFLTRKVGSSSNSVNVANVMGNCCILTVWLWLKALETLLLLSDHQLIKYVFSFG